MGGGWRIGWGGCWGADRGVGWARFTRDADGPRGWVWVYGSSFPSREDKLSPPSLSHLRRHPPTPRPQTIPRQTQRSTRARSSHSMTPPAPPLHTLLGSSLGGPRGPPQKPLLGRLQPPLPINPQCAQVYIAFAYHCKV